MQLLSLLETAIAVVLVLALVSILTTAAIEAIAGLFHLRARELAAALRRMLGERAKTAFLQHPLIRSLSRNDRVRGFGPSYIRPDIFSRTLVDVVTPNGPFDSDQERAAAIQEAISCDRSTAVPTDASSPIGADGTVVLRTLVERVTTVEEFRGRVEEWYEATMERVVGWYNRRTRLWAFLIGLVIAAGMNIDTIALSSGLISDSTTRARLVAIAESLEIDGATQSGANAGAADRETMDEGDSQTNAYRALLREVAITTPTIGWSTTTIKAMEERFPDSPWLGWLLKALGWTLTAVAATLGAPFWFDLLSRLMHVRATGVDATNRSGATGTTSKREKNEQARMST